MKIRIFFAISVILASLTSCAQMSSHPMEMTSAIQNAKTSADHEALAKHYEDAAREMQLKVEEHKKLLEEYERHPYYYPKHVQDLQAHCRSLIKSYEQAVETNMTMAKIHRQIEGDVR